MIQMINNYVYWIENKDTNMSYVGVRSCDIEPIDDIGVKYFTSSQDKDFKQDFTNNPKKYNIEVINNFINRQEAANLEIQIHNWNNVGSNPKFYNRAKATSNRFDITGTKHSVETRKKMSENHWDCSGENSPMYGVQRLGKDNPFFGKKHSEETKARMSKNHWDISGENNPNYGKKFTQEHRDKISKAKKGKKPSAETRKKMSEAFKGEKNPNYGKKFTQEHRDKISKAVRKQKKVKCRYCGLVSTASIIARWHNDNCKKRGK